MNPQISTIRNYGSYLLAFSALAAIPMASAQETVYRGSVSSLTTGDDGTFTLNDGRVIGFTTSTQYAAISTIESEIDTVPASSDGSHIFSGDGSEIWYNPPTGDPFTVVLNLTGAVSSADLVLGIGHLYLNNQVQIFAVPIGGTLSTGTGGLASFSSSDHADISMWETYRAPVVSEDATVESSFIAVPSLTYNSTAGLESYAIRSTSGNFTNSTYRFLQTSSADLYDYIVLRYDDVPSNVADRWNLTLGNVAPVPEPSTALMIGLATVFAGLGRRKRRA